MRAKTLNNRFIASFCKEMASVLRSGMPLSDGVLLLLEYESDQNIKDLFQLVFEQLEKGSTLARALSETDCFPSYVVRMMKIGENTGRLDVVLNTIATYYERQEEIGKALKNALVFPGILMGVLLIVIITVMTQVMPVFEQVFHQMGIEMSPVAKNLTDFGRWMSTVAPVFGIVLAVIFVCILAVSVIKPLKKRFLKLFQFTRISFSIACARFAYTMAMTIASGMDVDRSLDMADSIVENEMLKQKIDECRNRIKKGESWAAAIAGAEIFPPMYNRMIALSFKTGNTDQVLLDIAEKTETDANERIESAISKIEPAIVVVMSVLVGLILLSVMLPLASVMTALG
jgi:type IV pilus assembly protein PilC